VPATPATPTLQPPAALPPAERPLAPAATLTEEAPAASLAKTGPGYGSVTTASGADPTVQYQLQYRVVGINTPLVSHTAAGEPAADYPQALQPRARDRAASQLQIDKIARELEPGALLTDSHRLDSGPPVLGEDRVVESGNGRLLALRRALGRYPDKLQAYEDGLRARLSEYGLASADLDGIPHPVLVRERLTPLTDTERAAFAAEANNAGLLAMSSYERAVQDAARLTDESVANLTVGEADTIASALRRADNRPFVRSFVASIPANERGELLDAAGNLNAQGYTRLANAILVKTFGPGDGERLARSFIESADPLVRNVETAVMASLPALARSEALVRRGERDAELALGPDLAAAIHTLARLRTQGIGVPDYLAQGSLWERVTTPFQDQVLTFLNENTRGPGRLRTALREYAQGVEAAPPPSQTSMFGGADRPTQEELWNAAVRRAAGEAPTEAPPAPTQAPGQGLAPGRRPRPVPELGAGQAPDPGPGLAQELSAAEAPAAAPTQFTPSGAEGPPAAVVPPVVRPAPPPSQPPTPQIQPSTAPAAAAPPPTEPPVPPASPTTPPPPPEGPQPRTVHTVGAGYWSTLNSDEQVGEMRTMLDEWAQFSRSGGVKQTRIYQLAQAMGQDPQVVHDLIRRAAGQDTRTPAAEQQLLRSALIAADEETRRLRDQLDVLKRQRARSGGDDSSTDADVAALAQSLAAAEASLRLAGLAERRNIEGIARALAQQKFVIAAGAGAEIVQRLDASVGELAGLLREIGEMQGATP
jgi:hypothetical protein